MNNSKPNLFNLISFVLFILVFVFFNKIIAFFADWLWFASCGFEKVFLFTVTNKIVFGCITGLIVLVVFLINYLLIMRFYNRIPQVISGDIIHLPSSNRRFVSVLVLAVMFFAGSLIVNDASGQWILFQKYLYSVPFNVAEPLFGKDISFYIFKLPFIQYVVSVLFLVFVSSLLISGSVYFFSRGLRGIPRNFDLPFKLKIHLIVLIAVCMIIQAFAVWFSRFSFVTSQAGMLSGAMYTDVYAGIPFSLIYSFLFAAAALVVFADLKSKCWKYTSASLAVLIIAPVLGYSIYPWFLQKFYVAPNELTAEAPFISRNIEFTRKAFNLDTFDEQEYPASENLTLEDIKKNSATINNVRLWDYKPLLAAYSELQEIRTYYKFSDVDFDRYTIDSKYRQTMISPRELDIERIPERKWINETFIYTHGYGACLAPVNQVSPDGLPEFFIKDVPPVSNIDIKITRPEIYFGEITDSYCIVNSKVKEFDYPAGDDNVYCSYEGSAGVKLDNVFKRLLFAAYFGELKILMSSESTAESRILYDRNIERMVKKIAPYIDYDSDPYMVVADGKCYWIIDGYMTSSNYPYSQKFGSVNYLRNSVKAVIDAYNGKVDFYISDKSDPLISVYSAIYKGLFKPIEQMPAGLKSHIRYPEDMFRFQSSVYAQYHMKDVQIFYNQEDLWKIPEQSEHGGKKTEPNTKIAFDGMEPYYTILKLPPPHGVNEEFVLMTPFSPARKSNMIAIMAARCDAPDYGQVIVYTLPKDKLTFGPTQINSRIAQDPEIAKQLTLWNQGDSTVMRGSLLAIPIEDSILYIEPLFLAAAKGKIPQLKKIFVVYGDKVAMEDTLEASLGVVFGVGKNSQSGIAPDDGKDNSADVSLKQLILDASMHYDRAKEHLKDGDWSSYGKELNEMENSLRLLKKSVSR